MPYLKLSQTTSGATAVQVATKHYGKTVVLKHFGSAHTKQELRELKTLAQAWLRPDGQLDLLTPPIDRRRFHTVAHRPYCFEQLIRAYYDKLSFSDLGSHLLFELVMMRLYEPCSKLRSIRLLADRFGRPMYAEETAYRLVKKLGAQNKDQQSAKTTLLRKLYDAHERYYGGDLAVLLYDVTTLYFESARDSDEYKVPGYSKDGKHKDPQILVGLLTNLQGFPLGYESFPGKTFEGHTLLSSLNNWRRQFKSTKLRIVADAGMLSRLNCDNLVEAGYDFVVGARLHSLPDSLTGQLKAMVKRNDKIQEFTYGNWRLIVQYQTKRAKKDLHTIDKAVAKTQAVVDGKQTLKRRSKFVAIDQPTKIAKSLDETAIAEAKALAGLKGYITNLESEIVPAKELIAQYHELWHVERSFRMSKNDLRARPIFHHLEENIKGHLFIVVMALAVSKLLERDSGVSVQKIVDQLSNTLSYQQQDTATNETWWQHPELDEFNLPTHLREILDPLMQGD
jgi:transposase